MAALGSIFHGGAHSVAMPVKEPNQFIRPLVLPSRQAKKTLFLRKERGP